MPPKTYPGVISGAAIVASERKRIAAYARRSWAPIFLSFFLALHVLGGCDTQKRLAFAAPDSVERHLENVVQILTSSETCEEIVTMVIAYREQQASTLVRLADILDEEIAKPDIMKGQSGENTGTAKGEALQKRRDAIRSKVADMFGEAILGSSLGGDSRGRRRQERLEELLGDLSAPLAAHSAKISKLYEQCDKASSRALLVHAQDVINHRPTLIQGLRYLAQGVPLEVLPKPLRIPEGMRLPEAESSLFLPEAAQVVATIDAILFNEEKVFGIRNGTVPPTEISGGGFLIEPLFQMLIEHVDHQKKVAKYNPNAAFDGRIVFAIDARLPHKLLSQLMYTAGQAEFSKFSLAVRGASNELRAQNVSVPAIGVSGDGLLGSFDFLGAGDIRGGQSQNRPPSITVGLDRRGITVTLSESGHGPLGKRTPRKGKMKAQSWTIQPTVALAQCRTSAGTLGDACYDMEALRKRIATLTEEYPSMDSAIVCADDLVSYSAVAKAIATCEAATSDRRLHVTVSPGMP